MSYKSITNWMAVICLSLLFCSNIFAQSPFFKPGEDPTPPGMKWVKNEDLSDEFEGDKLDEEKWLNTDPNRWVGRPPGLFMREAISQSEGTLQITARKLNTPRVVKDSTFTHQGGLVASKNKGLYGYYECKVKASKTFMSTTFWLNE